MEGTLMSARTHFCATTILLLASPFLLAGEGKTKRSKAQSKGKASSKAQTKRKFSLGDRLDPANAPDKSQTAKQKKWLKKVLTYNIKSRKFKKDIARKVDSLSPSQTDKLVVLAKKRIYDFEKERLEQARRNLAKARSYRNQLLRRRNGSGFRPVITTLNSGVALGAGAVVGPDGRTVRLSLNPFFSELGPVDTFNFFTGETRRIYTPPRQRRRRGASCRTSRRTR